MGNTFSNAHPVTEEPLARAIFADQQQYVLRCMFVPLIFDLVLLGVFLMQVYTYFTYQKNDGWWTKGPVILVLTLQLIFSGYHTWFVQWLFVEHFGLWATFFVTKGLAWAPFQDSLTSFVVQCFMSYRAYRLNNRALWIPICVFILCLISVGATLSVLIIFYNLNSLMDAPKVFIPEVIWLTSIMTADLIITGSIVYGLSQSKTGWSKTDKTIGKLVRMTIEGQIPPLIIAMTFMIEFIIEPANLLGALLQNLQPKFYAVGMMYSVNARISFQRQLESQANEPTNQVFGLTARSRNPTQIQVAVETETYVQNPTGPYSQSYPGGEEAKRDYDDSLDGMADKDQANVFNSQSHLTQTQSVNRV